MHLHPHASFQLAQLERPDAPRNPEVPVPASRVSGQLSLGPDDEAQSAAFRDGLRARQPQIESEHL